MTEKIPLRISTPVGTVIPSLQVFKPGETVPADNLPVFTGDTPGLVPSATVGDAAKVLAGDGSWVDQAEGGDGDVTGPGSSTVGYLPKWGDTAGNELTAGVAAPTGAIVGTSDAQTLTNKVLTAPTIADFTDATHTHQNAAGGGTLDAAAIASGTIATARLGSGTANSTTFLRGDQTYATPAGGGDVSGPGSSTTGNVPTYADTSGTALDGGFPVSAAAKTVLDDATVADMRTTLGVDPAGTDNSTPVTLSGSLDYLSLSGQDIVRGPIDLQTDVTGVLPHGNLGTGGGGSTKFLREDSTFQEIPGGGDALTSNPLSQFAATTSAQLAGVLSDETGSGAAVFATSPTLVTPALGTPSAVVLTNATGLPTAGLVDGAVTYAKIQDVSATDKVLGRATTGAGDVEEIACTAAGRALIDDATAGDQRTTLGLGTVAVENTVPIAKGGTGQTTQTAGFDALSPTTTKGDLVVDDGTNAVRLPVGATDGHVLTVDAAEQTGVKWAAAAGGGDALTTDGLDQFAATTSAELAGVISDETGSGALVFATSPTLTTPNIGTPSAGTLTSCTGLPTGGVTVSATDRLIGRVSASGGVAEEIPITDFVQTILDDADAAAVRATIGAGTGDGDALTSGHLGQFAATTSAQLAGVLSDETGSGAAVFATSPTLVTPALGTPSAAVLTNATGLPTAGLVDGAVTFAKMQAVSADVLLGNDSSGTAVEEITCTAAGRALLDDANAAAQLTTLGAEATANKGVASGYCPLDALGMVPSANQRPREWDRLIYGFHKKPGRAAIHINGPADAPYLDGIQTDSPGNGGSWMLVEANAEGHGGLLTRFNVIQTRWSPTIQFAVKTPASLTAARYWIGISGSFIDSTAPVADAAAFTIPSVAFCWDATVHSGSNFWRTHTSGGSNATVITSGVSIAVDTEYDLRMVIAPTTVSFYINDTLAGTAHTTNLPSTSATLGIGLRCTTSILWKRVDVQHD